MHTQSHTLIKRFVFVIIKMHTLMHTQLHTLSIFPPVQTVQMSSSFF